METDNFKKIDTTAKFSNFKVLNPDFIRCRCNVMYPGRNRNYTDITKKAVLKLIERKGYANVPVVGHIKLNKNGKKIMGSHDRKLEISNDGIQEINECTAMGVVPENCDPSFEKIIDKHGIEREYFSVDVILWSHYFPDLMETAYSDEIYFNHSMEIRMNETEWDDDYIVINDFSLQALCLLGKSTENPEDNSEPCFEDSVVKRFSVDTDKFKQNFELMLEKLKQYESDGTTATVQNNPTTKTKQMKGDFQRMNLKKITEALSAVKCDDRNEVSRYRLLDATESKIYALDLQEGYKPCGFDYAITKDEGTDNVIIDFESKAEMSLSATDKIEDKDFEEFSIIDEINTIKEEYSKENVARKEKEVSELISAEFRKDYDELKEAYDTLMQSHSILQGKVDTYEKKENDAKIEAHKEDIRSLINSYSEKLGKCSAYLVYKSNMDSHYEKSHEQVEQDLILMAGKYLTSKDYSANKKFSYNPVSTKVSNNTQSQTIEGRYGHLLDKYLN